MPHGYDWPRNGKRSSQVFTDEEEDGGGVDNEEDNTARLSGRRRQSKTAHEDNTSALDRVRSLTQRNRMVLDKLSSISRNNSPAPISSPAPSNNPRSPVSPPSAIGTSSRTSVRPQSASNPLPTPARRIENSHSGSETERESQHNSYSSDDLVATPPSRPEIRAPFPIRERRISAPASPAKGRPQRDRDRGPSPGPSRTPRKRMSMAMSVDEGHRHTHGDEDDVLTSALAAVASSRRSPGSGKKSRQPLPREFRDRRSPEEKPQGEPSTPHRNRNGYDRSSPSSPRGPRSTLPSNTQLSPRRPGQPRYSTVRDLTRKHQTRWLSEDLSASLEDEEPSYTNESIESVGRRQGHRGGSSDTLLAGNGGRTLIGEGLRAAGLAKRRDPGDDLFGGELTAPGSPRRTKSTGNSSIVQGQSGLGAPPPRFDPHTPVNNAYRRDDRMTRSGGMLARPGTSMAALHHDTPEIPPPRTAPPGLRAYKSTYVLAARESVTSPQVQQEFADRAYSSPFASVRAASTAAVGSPGLNKDMNAEHRRLMMEALTMFESQLSRFPPMGQTTTNTIPELFQTAQHVVHSLDKLNGMLKSGTNCALEAQIDAEVTDLSMGIDLPELWREVGAEHRENLRMSDEVVRNMTGFLLGVGKVLRDATSAKDPQQHLRTVSLDESPTTRLAPDTGVTHSGGRSSDGRKSRGTRRSWDPRDARESSLARLSSLERSHVRPASALHRSSTTSSSEGRSVADAVDGTPQTIKVSTMAPSSSIRRMYLSRDQRATPEGLAPIHTNLNFAKQGSPDKYEPSPTPTSRTSLSALSERQRNFPPASVAPSLSTLPSESLITRTVSTSSSENSNAQRKVSSSSTLTVRAEPSASSPFSAVLRPPGATTSLTPATISAERSPGEPPVTAYYRPNMDRSESSGSSRAGPNRNVDTVSRASLARLRSASNASSAMDDEPPVRLEAAPILSPMSGNETERPESWRRTVAARPRASLESAWEREREERNATRNATVAGRKERRRTITEIFQR
ncbi:hypothetical protein EVJ58_g1931 [Rhodofomes roseus]|uniref:Uncharacterized protein n=1 Tax=Rhodofomes roseus TaxID=34475 RepID=A0A4Y9YSG7_9APHY|nr:hypothetical protein EVJ58_g1931 [Rhodofomes roseus]